MAWMGGRMGNGDDDPRAWAGDRPPEKPHRLW
jgi:hypothetical protein